MNRAEAWARWLVAVALVTLLSLALVACGTRSLSAPFPVAAGGLTTEQDSGTLTVFAAASLADAFQEIGRELEADGAGLRIDFNFAGSQQLRTQLAQGARADLFASADAPTMAGAQVDGTVTGTPRVFTENRLVLITPAANPARIERLEDLATPGLKLVLADEQVPVGAYARQALDKMGAGPAFGADFPAKVLANLVSNESNVRQVVAKVQLGEADVGIVYASDAEAAGDALRVFEIPPAVNVTARYPLAMVTDAPNPDAAARFIDYVLSPAGQEILSRHGFLPVDTE